MPLKNKIALTSSNLAVERISFNPKVQNRDAVFSVYSKAIIENKGLAFILPFPGEVISSSINEEEKKEIEIKLYNCALNYLNCLDALILTGGGDFYTAYGQQNNILYYVDYSRDLWEFALLKAAVKLNKKVLGICRGLQIINLFFGGNLWEDLKSQNPSALTHWQIDNEDSQHQINIVKNTKLSKIINKQQLTVNSRHHQAIKGIAPNLIATSHTEDGLIESLEDHKKNIIAVQWHPEALKDESSNKLFKYFINL